MSVLAILLPPRARLGAGAGSADAAASPAGELAYALSADGLALTASGRAAPALLPKADAVVAVLEPSDVSWQKLTLPKAPASKLRAALEGLLEEALLEETGDLHFALPAQAQAGQEVWVAVTHKGWLQGALAELERTGLIVDRVVPALTPQDGPRGHIFDAGSGGAPQPALTWVDDNGVACVPLAGSLARTLLASAAAQGVRWTATPAVATAAERWLGAPVSVLTEAESAWRAVQSTWNLRQFDLAARHRGAVALKQAFKRLRSPAWKPVRLGLVALAGLQVIGLNVWAWSQHRALDDRRQAQIALLRTTHPQVRSVLDAPAQMRRETEQLRTAAGRSGETDLEPMMAAAAAAWPDGQGPMQGLRFEPGRLTLTVAGWSEDHVRQFRDRLRPAGWSLEIAPGKVTLLRGPSGTSGGAG